jgi:DeoR family fructose operon transcriptional repressor
MIIADGTLQHEQAAGRLGVSVMTVRRDLAHLEATGALRRVRGGAIAQVGPRSFAERRATRASVKARIAGKAAELIGNAAVLALDASSTCAMVVDHLGTARRLLIATNAIDTARAAGQVPGVRAVLVGGEIDAHTGSLVGPIATRGAAQLAYDICFVSAAAVDLGGTSEVSLDEGEAKVALARQAARTILLADSSKLGQRAAARAFDWGQVELMITELSPDDPALDPYRRLVALG